MELWQNQLEFDAIVFDCDSTLSSLEGIDELAMQSGAGEEVAVLTREAMDEGHMGLALYEKRLQLVKPTRQQVESVGRAYCYHTTPAAMAVIHALRQLGKTIYVVSAGLLPAVRYFAEYLGVAAACVSAVDIQFDKHGHYLTFDTTSPLIHSNGKRTVITQLQAKHQNILMIGDGMNDIVTKDLVSRFVGFGGLYCRRHIAELADFYITVNDLSALLPLTLTHAEIARLNGSSLTAYEQGQGYLSQGKIQIKERVT